MCKGRLSYCSSSIALFSSWLGKLKIVLTKHVKCRISFPLIIKSTSISTFVRTIISKVQRYELRRVAGVPELINLNVTYRTKQGSAFSTKKIKKLKKVRIKGKTGNIIVLNGGGDSQ